MTTSICHYYMTPKPNSDADDHDRSSNPVDHLFEIELHFSHALQIFYPETLAIPLETYMTSFQYLREDLLSPDVCTRLISSMLNETGVLSDMIKPMVDEVYSFALEMDANPSNANTSLTMVLIIFVITPYEDREDINRALAESMQTQVNCKFKPASEEAIKQLERKEVVGNFARVNGECRICLEEFLIGCDIARMPCGHVFHDDCIVRWLQTSHLCPLCRYAMPAS